VQYQCVLGACRPPASSRCPKYTQACAIITQKGPKSMSESAEALAKANDVEDGDGGITNEPVRRSSRHSAAVGRPVHLQQVLIEPMLCAYVRAWTEFVSPARKVEVTE
jgi:hypothetical protein